METAERALKRSELYGLVWSQPLTRVAADIGVSDVAVAKACRRAGVPLPGRGYWRRRTCGYRVRQLPLRALPGGQDPIITFHANLRQKPEEPVVVTPELEFEQRPENRVVVPENLETLSRPVRHTRAVLRTRKPDQFGLVSATAKDCFRVEIAPGSTERAMRILQALAGAFAARGYEVVEGADAGTGLQVRLNGELLTLRLTERSRRVVHVPSEREEIRKELNPGWKPPLYDWVPTGILTLRIPNAPCLPQHASWRDRAKEPVEQRLNAVLAGMAEAARGIRERREAQERAKQEWEEKEKRIAEARRKAELEGARFRRLEHLAMLWQRRETCLKFLSAVKERMKVARPELIPTAQAWIEWAEAYFEDHQPTDPLFFEPLLEHRSQGYHHWTVGYGQRDTWVDEWH